MTVWDMSLGGGVLIAVILVLRRGLLYHLPKWTFLLLWAVALFRLLIPIAVPSPLSVHTSAAWVVQLLEKDTVSAPAPGQQTPALSPPIPSPDIFREDMPVVPGLPAPVSPVERESVSPLTAVWLTGTALCGLFFAAAYLWSVRRFWDAVPAESDFVRSWQKAHPTLIPLQIKVCEAVSAPLAYGLLRPVVLLPGDTDWSDENQLTYALTHEYIHIRRGDLLWKALLTAAFCVHWFNPLVWIMYLRANQDLELACDEAVVRTLGMNSRKGYAYALLAAAESGFSPLCITYTTKNHMEERIRAIMKIKKRSTAVMICAAMLVAGVSAVFATSPKPAEAKNIEDLPPAVMTNQTAKPTSTPTEKEVSETTPERVHPITVSVPDDSAEPQPTPSVPEPEPVQPPVEPVEPVADTPEPAEVPAEEDAGVHISFNADDPVEFWGIPEGPIAAGARLSAHNEEEFREMIRQLRMMGYDGSFGLISYLNDGSRAVVLGEDYDGVVRTVEAPERFPDWTYPVNSKGETYGTMADKWTLGYDPDLVSVRAANGADGYALGSELDHGDYMGPMATPEDMMAFMEWQDAQPNPRLVPVYDVDRDNIVGYFEIYKSVDYGITPDMSLEEARELVRQGPPQ